MNVEEWFAAVFWPAYPLKVKKPLALKELKKLKPGGDTRNAIMAGLERWKASDAWTKEGGKYRSHPTTFLKGHMWEDDPGPTQQQQTRGYTLADL